jgi:glycosyltransferase involved in cell wall biosynthesis
LRQDGRSVLMLTHSYYEEDPRVRREAEALAQRGLTIDVFALRRPGEPPADVVAGVNVRRFDVQRHQGSGLGTYLAEYLSFFIRAGWAATAVQRHRRHDLVQVHTPPDFLVFAAMPLRMAGVPVVIDLHEAMPEFFRIRFPRASRRLWHLLLVWQERASVALSTATLTVNEALRERLVGLGVPSDKVVVVRNAPSLHRFDPTREAARPFMSDGVLRLVYAGALSPVYELDVVLAALGRIGELRPELVVSLDLYGRDFAEVPLAEQAVRLGLGERVQFHGRIPIEDVPAAIAAGDVGLAPTRRNPFTDFSVSTKLLEYAAMARPVVASRLPLVERMFPADTVLTYEPGDAGALAAAILHLVDDPTDREARVARTSTIVRNLGWEGEAERYGELIERLIERRQCLADPRPKQEAS